jgi:hypothetical protein
MKLPIKSYLWIELLRLLIALLELAKIIFAAL